jgi:hypothetical protein
VARRDGPSVLLALKENLETDQRVDLQDADAVDATIAGPTCDGDSWKPDSRKRRWQKRSNPAAGRDCSVRASSSR